MNDLLKFTIIITIVESLSFILLQCVLSLSDLIKQVKQLLASKDKQGGTK